MTVAGFLLFAFSTTFTDLHNFTASLKGVEVKDLEHAELLWPPKVCYLSVFGLGHRPLPVFRSLSLPCLVFYQISYVPFAPMLLRLLLSLQILTDVYFKWARTVDPLLYANPVWW